MERKLRCLYAALTDSELAAFNYKRKTEGFSSQGILRKLMLAYISSSSTELHELRKAAQENSNAEL